MGNFVLQLPSFFTIWFIIQLIFYLIIISIVGFLIWLFYNFYPRFFTIGHTDSQFATFMEKYVADFVKICVDLSKSQNPKIKSSIAAAKKFIAMYKDKFKIDLSKSDVTDVSLDNPDFLRLFMLFMFFHDLKNGISSKCNLVYALDILQDHVTSQPCLNIIKGLYDKKYASGSKPTYYNLDGGKKKELLQMYNAFLLLKKTCNGDAKILKDEIDTGCPSFVVLKEHVDVILLDLMVNVYLYNKTNVGDLPYPYDLPYHHKINTIERIYRARMKANAFNIAFLYIEDYTIYIFVERIVNEIWKPYPVKAKDWMESIQKFVTKPEIMHWIADLPTKLAGEGYRNFTQKDNVEHFAGIEKMVMAFVYLAQVFASIADFISSPMAVIKFLIGAVIALTLEILYFLFVLLTDVIIAPVLAYVGLIWLNLWLTCVSIILWLLYAILYFTLGILDVFTGGAIMSMLRCENRPDSWAFTPNWMRGNKFTRSFFCSRSCAKRYYPDYTGLLCVRQKRDEPTFAPQQVIYQTWKNIDYITYALDKIEYSHKPKKNYFVNMTDDERKEMWNEVYTQQVDYMKETQAGFGLYDSLISAMCLEMTNEDNGEIASDTKAKIKSLCSSCYCTTGSRKKLEFCKIIEQSSNLISMNSQGTDIVLVTIGATIIIIVLFTIVTLLFLEGNKYIPPKMTQMFYDAAGTFAVSIGKFKLAS